MVKKELSCSACGKEKRIVNSHFKLCLECNNKRLYGNIYGKQYNSIDRKRSPLRSDKNKFKGAKIKINTPPIKSTKKRNMLELDEKFYEECFNLSDHKCEECGCQLPTEFRNDDGKIIARWRYSHIIPKSIAPELRHNVNNINHLCLHDHAKWENGDKKSMKIYKKNRKNFPNYF